MYDLQAKRTVDRGTIPDHETFVIFDQYRTRGADFKMKTDVVAALSLSAQLTKDSIMQAVGRMRKLGRNQKLVIILTEEVKMKIREMYRFEEKWSCEEKVKAILNWACLNSLKETRSIWMMVFSKVQHLLIFVIGD